MKLLAMLFPVLLTCSLSHKTQHKCEKEILSKIGKCDINNKEHEKVLVYLELTVVNYSLEVDTLIGNIDITGEKIIKTIIDCSNVSDLEIHEGCNIKFIYNRHGIKNHDSSEHRKKILSFKKEHGLDSTSVYTATYYDY